MKTRMMKMMGWMLMIVGMMSLTSCEVEWRIWDDNVHHTDNSYELCSRTWEESWTDNGNRYTQRLDFYNNRTGRDYLRIEYWNGDIPKTSIVSTGDGMTTIASAWNTVRAMSPIWKISGSTTTRSPDTWMM